MSKFAGLINAGRVSQLKINIYFRHGNREAFYELKQNNMFPPSPNKYNHRVALLC